MFITIWVGLQKQKMSGCQKSLDSARFIHINAKKKLQERVDFAQRLELYKFSKQGLNPRVTKSFKSSHDG